MTYQKQVSERFFTLLAARRSVRGRECEGVGGASQLTPSTLTVKPRRSRKSISLFGGG